MARIMCHDRVIVSPVEQLRRRGWLQHVARVPHQHTTPDVARTLRRRRTRPPARVAVSHAHVPLTPRAGGAVWWQAQGRVACGCTARAQPARTAASQASRPGARCTRSTTRRTRLSVRGLAVPQRALRRPITHGTAAVRTGLDWVKCDEVGRRVAGVTKSGWRRNNKFVVFSDVVLVPWSPTRADAATTRSAREPCSPNKHGWNSALYTVSCKATATAARAGGGPHKRGQFSNAWKEGAKTRSV